MVYEKYGQKFKVWQDRYDAVVLFNKDVIHKKLSYIHNNPVKKKLVENENDWIYSSSKFYLDKDIQNFIEIRNVSTIF